MGPSGYPPAEVSMSARELFNAIPFDAAPYMGLEANGQITVLRDVVYGGPSVEPMADRRMYFDLAGLRELVALAERSPTGRVQIDHAGLRVRRVLDGGHVVEVLSVTGTQPKPEPWALGVGSG